MVPWIQGKAPIENAAEILMRVNHKMIEPGKILHVAAVYLGKGILDISLYKVDAVTHIKYYTKEGEKLYGIYTPITEDQIRELIDY